MRNFIKRLKGKRGGRRSGGASVLKFFRGRFAGSRAPVNGLRITPGFVEWTALRKSKKGFEILASGNAALAPEAGETDEAESRAEKIRKHCAEIKGPVSVGIAPDKILMRVIELPTTEPAEIVKMIQLQADAFSPFPEEHRYVAHEVLSAGQGGTRVLIAAARKELIESTGSFLKAAGLDVQRFDGEAVAWWHLLARHASFPREGRQLILILEPWGGVWIVVQNQEPLAFRSVNPAGNMPAGEYARELSADASAFMLAIDLEHGGLPLVGITVWQRGLDVKDITEVLKAELGHEVAIQSLDSLPPLSDELARRFAGAGLSSSLQRVKDGQAVLDLVPEAWHSFLLAQRLRRRLILAGAGVLALWLLAMTVFVAAYQFQKYNLGKLEHELQLLREPEKEVIAMQNQARAFEQYLDRRSSALECLRETSRLLPDNVLLKNFQFHLGKYVVIRGEALSPDPIYDYKKALDKAPLFGKVELGSIQPGKRKDASIQTFQMNARLKEQP